jgi:tRNA pseudouridine55 synthase
MHGWIIIDKPLGLGSTQVVSAVKRALREAGAGKVKVGHGGTLDPLATGVLPIALGEATKLAGRMLDSDKIYDFTIRFGEQTSTLDAEGEVIAMSDVRPTLAEVQTMLPHFTGPIEQAPPAYSAIKVDGRRAYDLARAGEEVEMKLRSVTIHALSFGAHTGTSALSDITLTAHVSKGTYIRSLARDISLALGTVGYVTMLRRVKAGPFTLGEAISLDNLSHAANERAIERHMLPLTAGLDDIPALLVTSQDALLLRQGRVLPGCDAATGLHLAIDGNIPVALVEIQDGEIRVVRGFNLMSREED